MGLFRNRSFIGFFQISLIYVIQNITSYLIVPNYSIIKQSLGVSDLYLGLLTGGFLFFNAFASIFWSLASDAVGFKRKLLLFTGFSGASFFMFITYISNNPYVILITWVLAGASLGVVMPLGFSIISDMFPPRFRVSAFMLWYTIGGFGLGFGYLIALLSGTYYGWKTAILWGMLILLLVGCPISLLLYEPKKASGDLEEAIAILEGFEYKYRFDIKDITLLTKNKSNIYITLQGVFGTIPNGVIFTWAVHYISRELNASIVSASLIFGLMSTGALGGLFVSHLADKLHVKRTHFKSVLAGVSSIIEATLFIFFFLTPVSLNIYTDSFSEAFKLIVRRLIENPLVLILFLSYFTAMFFNAAVGPIKNSVITDVNLPEHRATVVSGIALMELFSKSIGISIIGFLSDYFGNLRYPTAFAMVFWYASGIAWLIQSKHYNFDKFRVFRVLETRFQIGEKS